MTSPWSGPGQVLPDAVTVLEGPTFCVSSAWGDLDRLRPTGLFVRDTRMLDRWDLEVAGLRPEPLTVHHSSPHTVLLVGRVTVPDGTHEVDLLVQRERYVGGGMLENLQLRNVTAHPVRVRLTLQVGADFADLATIREGGAPVQSEVKASVGTAELELASLDAGLHAVTVTTDPTLAVEVDETGFAWEVDLEAHGTWSTYLQAVPRVHGVRLQPHHVPGAPPEEAAPARRQRQLRRSTPRLTTASRPLADVLATSLVDLGALRLFDPDHPRLPVVAAGAPWAMGALAAKDSLLTSLMLLSADPHLALGTLTILGAHQGTSRDETTGEEPGRIPDRLRFGASSNGTGARASFDSVDVTPLYATVAGALHRWHPQLVSSELTQRVERALEWTLGAGDTFLGSSAADGRAPAIAQAYTYTAYLARAEMADAADQSLVAARWRVRAERLKEAFDEHFWMPRQRWYTAALDRDARPVEAIGSHAIPCLWAGLVDDAHVEQVVERLMSPELFTGWGIRTLSRADPVYNPFGSRTGAVRPQETAMCVAGLTRYGFMDEARTLAEGMLDAATAMGNRLPELFAGVPRSDVPVPLPHPAACSPHASAAAAPVQMLNALMQLIPTTDGLSSDPRLPASFLPLEMRGLWCRGVTYDLLVDTEGSQVVPRH